MLPRKGQKRKDEYKSLLIGNLHYPTEMAVKESLRYVSSLYEYAEVTVLDATTKEVLFSTVQDNDIVREISSIMKRQLEVEDGLDSCIRQLPTRKQRTGIKRTFLFEIDISERFDYVFCVEGKSSFLHAKTISEDSELFILLAALVSLYQAHLQIEKALITEPDTKLPMRSVFLEEMRECIRKNEESSFALIRIAQKEPFRKGDMDGKQRERFLSEAATFLRYFFKEKQVYFINSESFGIIFPQEVNVAFSELEKLLNTDGVFRDDVQMSCVVTPLNIKKSALEHLYILESNLFESESGSNFIVREPLPHTEKQPQKIFTETTSGFEEEEDEEEDT